MTAAQAMPSECRRIFGSPRPQCPVDCPGKQRDGSCLLDLVRAANEAGVRWAFEIDDRLPNLRVEHAFWDYVGDPIPGLVVERRDFGAIHTRWEPGFGPALPEPSPPPVFDCPHCGARNEQDRDNFHWWCGECGRNANDAG